MQNDVATVNRLLADDYLGINPNGTLETKADALAQRRSGTMKISSIDPDNMKVRVYGDTAVVTSRVRTWRAMTGTATSAADITTRGSTATAPANGRSSALRRAAFLRAASTKPLVIRHLLGHWSARAPAASVASAMSAASTAGRTWWTRTSDAPMRMAMVVAASVACSRAETGAPAAP